VVVKLNEETTETYLDIYYIPDGSQLVEESQKIVSGSLDVTYNYAPAITDGTASVYIDGTSVFLKYAFTGVKRHFGGTIYLGKVGSNLDVCNCGDFDINEANGKLDLKEANGNLDLREADVNLNPCNGGNLEIREADGKLDLKEANGDLDLSEACNKCSNLDTRKANSSLDLREADGKLDLKETAGNLDLRKADSKKLDLRDTNRNLNFGEEVGRTVKPGKDGESLAVGHPTAISGHSIVDYNYTVDDLIRFVVTIEKKTTETNLNVYYVPDGIQLAVESQQNGGGFLDATYDYDSLIANGTASVYISGTSVFLKYAFTGVEFEQSFSGTVNLGTTVNDFDLTATGNNPVVAPPTIDDSKIDYHHTADKVRFIVWIDEQTTETNLDILYVPDESKLVDQSQQIAEGPLDVTYNYDTIITNGTASVYINGTSAFLKYSFTNVNQPFSGTIKLGKIGGTVNLIRGSSPTLRKVDSNLKIRGAGSNLDVEGAGSNPILRNVRSNPKLRKVRSNLDLGEVGGSLNPGEAINTPITVRSLLAPTSDIDYHHTVDKIRFVVKINGKTTESILDIYYIPNASQLVNQSQQINGSALDVTYNYTGVITDGTASVYLNGTSAFLKYAFTNIPLKFHRRIRRSI
ncbi:hypothetical protein H0H87_010050, partial [Tephrocybe sp. NHM501043]